MIAEVKTTGCNGFCENGPIVKIMPDNLVYYKAKPKDAEEIIEKTVLGRRRSKRLMYQDDSGAGTPPGRESILCPSAEGGIKGISGRLIPRI